MDGPDPNDRAGADPRLCNRPQGLVGTLKRVLSHFAYGESLAVRNSHLLCGGRPSAGPAVYRPQRGEQRSVLDAVKPHSLVLVLRRQTKLGVGVLVTAALSPPQVTCVTGT
jgi:hypothetical protein